MGDNFAKNMENLTKVTQGIGTVVNAGIGIKNALSPRAQELQGSSIGLRSGGVPSIGGAQGFNAAAIGGSQPLNGYGDYIQGANAIQGASQVGGSRKGMPDHYGTLMDVLKIYRG